MKKIQQSENQGRPPTALNNFKSESSLNQSQTSVLQIVAFTKTNSPTIPNIKI